jgi:hypothetical protein
MPSAMCVLSESTSCRSSMVGASIRQAYATLNGGQDGRRGSGRRVDLMKLGHQPGHLTDGGRIGG